MQESKRRIPHFAYVEEVDVTELEELRVHLNGARRDDQPRLTFLPFLIRALVQVLPADPTGPGGPGGRGGSGRVSRARTRSSPGASSK